MKRIVFGVLRIMLIAVVSSSFTSCLKEDNVSKPVVSDIQLFMTDVNGNDSLITEVFSGSKIKFVVTTDADMVSVWPGGVRKVMKKQNSTQDSIDMYGHPVLEASDHYDDYGLVKARGLNTSLGDTGWYVFYTYPAAGEFNLTILATNHGYDGPELKRTVYDGGTISVK